MGCRLLIVLCFLSVVVERKSSFVAAVPVKIDTARSGYRMASWKIYSQDRKFQFFDETKEKKWNGPFYFVQGADIQFGFIDRELKNSNVITWEEEKALAESIVDKINQMNPKPRFFAMCGDLCDAMPDSEPEMRKRQEHDYKRIFGKLDQSIPLISVCGNHDIGNVPTMESMKMFHTSFGDDYFSFYCGGILFLVINSQYFFDSSKVQSLASEHSKWIDEKLEEAVKEKMRVVVFQHIPWFLKTIDENESYFTLNANIRKKWLDKFQKAGVEAIFCGHYHRNAGGTYNGIDVVVTSAVGGQLGNDEPGARIVSVTKKKIEHIYFGTKNLPLNNTIRNGEFRDDVKELESLKSAFSGVKDSSDSKDEISVSKSEISVLCNLNCSGSAHKEINSKVSKDGQVMAQILQKIDVVKNEGDEPKSKTKTEINLPFEGIHEVLKNGADLHITKDKPENSGNRNEKMNSFSEIKYRPRDMAEYIFWTGDEKTIALTIEEFLEQGLMSRQEAINFLQSIKFNLYLLQSQYQELDKLDDKISEEGAAQQKINYQNEETFIPKQKKNFYNKLPRDPKLTPVGLVNVNSESFVVEPEKQNNYAGKLNDGSAKSRNENILQLSTPADFDDADIIGEDYEKMIEKIKERLRKTDALQEIIFELAKTMFYESLVKGNAGAQKAMRRFSAFLQKELKRGQISADLEKKVLGSDYTYSSLLDVLYRLSSSLIHCHNLTAAKNPQTSSAHSGPSTLTVPGSPKGCRRTKNCQGMQVKTGFALFLIAYMAHIIYLILEWRAISVLI